MRKKQLHCKGVKWTILEELPKLLENYCVVLTGWKDFRLSRQRSSIKTKTLETSVQNSMRTGVIYLFSIFLRTSGRGGGGRGKSSILLPPCPCRRWKNAEKNLSLFWRLLEIESLYCVISSYSVTLSKNSPTIPKDKGWSLISKLPNFPHPTLPWMRQRLNNVAKMKTLSPVSASHSCSHLI